MFILIALLALSSATLSVVTSNLKQSNFFLAQTKLRATAESRTDLAIHDLKYGKVTPRGLIGTESWDAADDYGQDGIPGTNDPGEGDGLPTPGEPSVVTYACGAAEDHISLCTYVEERGDDVVRVVGAATNGESVVSVEKYYLREPMRIPRAGALVVPPGTPLRFAGNAFLIDGNDHLYDGSPSGEVGVTGLVTMADPDNPGKNREELLASIDRNYFDQLNGSDVPVPEPSVGEVSSLPDLNEFYSELYALHTHTVEPGVRSGIDLGDYLTDDLRVTHVPGDLKLTGNGAGAGVLIVDGDLEITGTYEFKGLVVVKGNLVVSGGGGGFQVVGTTVTGTGLEAGGNAQVSGTADLYYSDEVLDKVEGLALSANYSFLYYYD